MTALEFTPAQQTSVVALVTDMGDLAELVRSAQALANHGPQRYRAGRRSSSSFCTSKPPRAPGAGPVCRVSTAVRTRQTSFPPPFPQPSGLFEAARETD